MEAYKIGVTLALTNQVSGVLGVIARDFIKVDADAKKLQATLKEIKLLGMAGAALGGAGFLGLHAIGAAVKPAEEYAHQLSLMNVAGMKQKEIAEATAAAWDTTGKVMSTSVNENMKAIRELRMVFGSTEEAIHFLPQMQKISAVLGNVLGDAGKGKANDVAFAAAKALELRGASKTPEAFQAEADLMTKAVIASGGKVRPQDLLQAVKYAGVAGTGFSRDFMYGILPTLVQELGGSSTGTALTSMSQALVGGVMSQRSLKTWAELGLVDMSKAIFTSTGSLKGIERGGIKGSELFQKDPFEYVQKMLIPALVSHGYKTEEQQQAIITRMFGNRTAARIANILATQGGRLQKDFNLIGEAGTSEAYDEMLKNDPKEQRKALEEQWETLKTALGIEVLPILIPALKGLTEGIHAAVGWAREHPTLTKALVLTFGALSALAAIGGTVLLASAGLMLLAPALGSFSSIASVAGAAVTAVIGGLRMAVMLGARALVGVLAASGPVGWIIAGIAAVVAGAYLVWKNWDTIRPKLMAVWEGISSFIRNLIDKISSAIPDWAKPTGPHVGGAKGIPGAPPPKSQTVQVNTQVNMDGRKVAEAVTTHQANEASRAPRNARGIDARRNLPPTLLPATP